MDQPITTFMDVGFMSVETGGSSSSKATGSSSGPHRMVFALVMLGSATSPPEVAGTT